MGYNKLTCHHILWRDFVTLKLHKAQGSFKMTYLAAY